MYPFSQSVNPAVRTHMDAQTAFINDMSKSMFGAFQQMCDLNIQLVQTLVEESTLAGQQVLSADRQGTELLTAASARAQPTTEKLRAYQRHIARLAADAQVDLARVTEHHVQNTSRTARALADEVTRSAAEETERSIRHQQEAMRSAADPFLRPNGEARPSSSAAGSTSAGGAGNGEASRGQQGAQQSSSQGARPSGAQTH